MNDRIARWENPPDLPATHYVDNRIFTDPDIFAREQEAIFAGGWKIVCHESELPEPGSYRALELAGRPIMIVRGQDGEIRAFYNICPHRGARLVRADSGTLKNRFQCFYHLWSFDLEGNCTGVTRPVGYEHAGLEKSDLGLRPIRLEVVCGVVFVSLNDDVEPVEDFLGPMLNHMREHMPDGELEVFHHHRAEINTNWKLWVDNNSELYHEYLHVLNRKTGLAHENYHKREWRLYPNSQNVIQQGAMHYQSAGLDARDDGLMPGMTPNGMIVMLLFPDVMINIRTTVMRLDTITPVAPNRTIVEWRGLGLKSDSAELREERRRHHNQVWGPAGRNLAEDVAAVESQMQGMASGAFRYSIYAREEELRPHDDANLRAFYAEWGRRVGIKPNDPMNERSPSLEVVGGAGE